MSKKQAKSKPKPKRRDTVPDGIQTKVLQALKIGNFRSTAAEFAGVSPAQLSAWLTRGDPASDDYEAGSTCAEFYKQVREAESQAEIRAVQAITMAGTEDPRHFQWWLERKFPSRWAKKDRLEVEDVTKGNQDAAKAGVDLSQLDDQELVQFRELMKKARGVADV